MEEAIQVESIDRLFMCVYVRYTLYNSIYNKKKKTSTVNGGTKPRTLHDCASVCDVMSLGHISMRRRDLLP